MKITISTAGGASVDWHSAGKDRVIQNVMNLMSISRYEIAYNRTLGIPSELSDTPSTRLAEQYQATLVELIEDNEPRASIESVRCLGISSDGQINFEVVLEVV